MCVHSFIKSFIFGNFHSNIGKSNNFLRGARQFHPYCVYVIILLRAQKFYFKFSFQKMRLEQLEAQ